MRHPPISTLSSSSAASDVYKRQATYATLKPIKITTILCQHRVEELLTCQIRMWWHPRLVASWVLPPVGFPLSPVDHPIMICLLYTSPSPRDRTRSRMPSSA
eukprot:TRINITY_DN36957_c0_g1_i1.p1 TRINITY_DN36957_c0_g1~~TRINITY_DN36957_c0_g1_i1.p1  ORF type:complete len:102 (+),score=4.02 TRINITY_DN36957_c0_g1_i1:13-318(+)